MSENQIITLKSAIKELTFRLVEMVQNNKRLQSDLASLSAENERRQNLLLKIYNSHGLDDEIISEIEQLEGRGERD